MTTTPAVTWACPQCGQAAPLDVAVQLWATLRPGPTVHADLLTVDGLRTEDFTVGCKLCGAVIDDLELDRRVNAHLRVLESEIGAELPPIDTFYIRPDGVALPPLRLAETGTVREPCDWVVELTTPRGVEVFGPYTYSEATSRSPAAHRIGRSPGYRYSPWSGQISVRVRGLRVGDTLRGRIEHHDGFQSLTRAEKAALASVSVFVSASSPDVLTVTRKSTGVLGTVHPDLHQGCWQANVATPGRQELTVMGTSHPSMQHAVIAVAQHADLQEDAPGAG